MRGGKPKPTRLHISEGDPQKVGKKKATDRKSPDACLTPVLRRYEKFKVSPFSDFFQRPKFGLFGPGKPEFLHPIVPKGCF